MKHSILCVDDEADNVDALERLFRRHYQVHKATSAAEGLKCLGKNQVTVIISDQRMPQMSGVEFLAQSIKTHPQAIRILLTGYSDIDSVISAINAGQIYRYVTKPWDPVDLSNAVDKAVERYEIGEELREKNRALSQALEELQTLDQAKNEFMILVNHELKTPLTSILSFSDLLNETNLDEDQKRFLSRIKSSALRLQDMVTDVLEFISAQTMITQVDTKAVRTSTLLSDVPEFIAKLMAHRKIKFEMDIENQTVVIDEKIIRNVLRRLLHNAAKFATPETVVELVGKTSSSGQYHIEIRNRGETIDEKTIRKILKPFTLNEDSLHHSAGTGLGLSVCQALLKRVGSELELSSSKEEIKTGFLVTKK